MTTQEITKVETGIQQTSPERIVERFEAIQAISKRLFKNEEHYGEPFKGSGKKVLLKAGAEVLNAAFQLFPRYDLEIRELGNGHREYIVQTEIISQVSNSQVGEGLGSCSTMEGNFRYRNIDEATSVPVPKTAWDAKNNNDIKEMKRILADALKENDIELPKGAEAGFVKDGSWFVSIRGKQENPDIADVYNTCLKMAKKRSHIDATLTALGISSMYTQDIDEFPEYEKWKEKQEPKADTKQQAKPKQPQSDLSELRDRITYLSELLPEARAKKLLDKLEERNEKWLKKAEDILLVYQQTHQMIWNVMDSLPKDKANMFVKALQSYKSKNDLIDLQNELKNYTEKKDDS